MISVIIPVYNGAEWLAEAIESVLDQTASIYEVIVVNDGSQDNFLEVANKYNTDISVKVYGRKITVINQVNKGLASARNTGIMNAKGEYCLFLDADDVLFLNCLDKIQDIIDETDADIITPSFKEFGLSDREIILMPNPTIEDFKIGNRLGYCAAIRRSILLEIGGYNPRMIEGYEDLHLWINLLSRNYKIQTIPEVLWFYRTKKESMYTKITPEIHTKLLAQINKDFPEVGLEF